MSKSKKTKEQNNTTAEQRMFQKYGLTLKGFHLLWVKSLGRCQICEANLHSRFVAGSEQCDTKRCNVDHCHETGEVRGLLCYSCNTALGKLGDDVDRMKKAITYLERPKTGISNDTGETQKQIEIRERAENATYGLDNHNRPRRSMRRRSGESRAEYEKRKALWSGASEREAERAYIDKVNSDYSSWRIHVQRNGGDPNVTRREKIELS